jgi:hypothetical protein
MPGPEDAVRWRLGAQIQPKVFGCDQPPNKPPKASEISSSLLLTRAIESKETHFGTVGHQRSRGRTRAGLFRSLGSCRFT